jgi:hypothetical protein
MSEKPESDEFEDEDAGETTGEDVEDLDQVIKDLDLAKRRGPKNGDPAWRRLEKLLEERHTAELTSDFDDYEIGDGGGGASARASGGAVGGASTRAGGGADANGDTGTSTGGGDRDGSGRNGGGRNAARGTGSKAGDITGDAVSKGKRRPKR